MTSKSRKLLLILSATACLATSCGGGKIDHDPDMDVDPSKHDDITLTTYFPNFGCDDRKVKDGFLAKELQSLTTYNVQFNQLPENSADTEINKLLSMHEPVDMLKCAPTVFNNYVASGSGYFTNLTPLVERTTEIIRACKKIVRYGVCTQYRTIFRSFYFTY